MLKSGDEAPAVGPQGHRHPGGQPLRERIGGVTEKGVRPRTVDQRHPIGPVGEKTDLVWAEVVSVDHQGPRGRRKLLEVVQRTPWAGEGLVFPGPQISQQLAERTLPGRQQLQFLARLGQVKGDRAPGGLR